MIISRLKQGFTYLFCKYEKSYDSLVKEVLSEEEFIFFDKMSEYDKVHSFNLLKLCLKNKILKDDVLYLKLALLHDSGKDSPSLYRRIRKVLIGDKMLDLHPVKGSENIKHINPQLAELIKVHHNKKDYGKMKIFQSLDDK